MYDGCPNDLVVSSDQKSLRDYLGGRWRYDRRGRGVEGGYTLLLIFFLILLLENSFHFFDVFGVLAGSHDGMRFTMFF